MTDSLNEVPHRRRRRRSTLRRTLDNSLKDAVSSAMMTASNDNFLNAFAIYLQASAPQLGLLTALPQFFGALMQLLSIWLGRVIARRKLVYGTAILQSAVVASIALLALPWGGATGPANLNKVVWLVGLAVLYHSCLNLIQPHWRAWMGEIVPPRRRGAFFAARTRLTMVASLAVFLSGGALLAGFEGLGVAGIGFAVLFAVGAAGRATSSYFLWRMHDPADERALHPFHTAASGGLFGSIRDYFADRTFLDYTLFIAGMQGVVAISAPFFAVYMLKYLHFSYLQFALTQVASVATQFAMLGIWGRFSDNYGNRLVMLITSCMLPVLPTLWLFSDNFIYLLLVQVISGFAWSGFSLCTANYLYDIRPHHTNFAAYASVQQAVGATAICLGALFGGFYASHAQAINGSLPNALQLGNYLFQVFLVSGLFRAGIALWFIPRCREPRIRKRPQMLEIVFRVARFNPISGVVLDWLTVTRKRGPRE